MGAQAHAAQGTQYSRRSKARAYGAVRAAYCTVAAQYTAWFYAGTGRHVANYAGAFGYSAANYGSYSNAQQQAYRQLQRELARGRYAGSGPLERACKVLQRGVHMGAHGGLYIGRTAQAAAQAQRRYYRTRIERYNDVSVRRDNRNRAQNHANGSRYLPNRQSPYRYGNGTTFYGNDMPGRGAHWAHDSRQITQPGRKGSCYYAGGLHYCAATVGGRIYRWTEQRVGAGATHGAYVRYSGEYTSYLEAYGAAIAARAQQAGGN